MPRSVDELVDEEDPAWAELVNQVAQAQVTVRILPVDVRTAEQTLYRLQVTTRSMMGAVALNCGGLVIDHGWLRILGGAAEGLPSLGEANGMSDPNEGDRLPPSLVVAFDVLGGQFAVNGGGLRAESGEVCYFGPDTLAWHPIGVGYSKFVFWALGGGLTDFSEHLRWPGWEQEVGDIPPS
jgi:hypothetical protein